MNLYLVFVGIFFLFSKPVISDRGFTLELIHPHSIHHPHYSMNLTNTELEESLTNSSFLRYASIVNAMAKPNGNNNQFSAPIHISPKGMYYMRLYIGTPPVQIFAIADTGSDLTWVHCRPCDSCYMWDTNPMLEASDSSTYKSIACNSKSCKLLDVHTARCSSYKTCYYEIDYYDGSVATGELAYERLIFDLPIPDRRVYFPKMMVGCGVVVNSTIPNSEGIVGLARSPLSLQSQLGLGKFSYCFDTNPDSYSYINFGDMAIFRGSSTPMITIPKAPLYFVNLTGISINEERLMLEDNIFLYKSEDGSGGFFVDSGTGLTLLRADVFEIFLDKFKQKSSLGYSHLDQGRPCFFGKDEDEDDLFPKITFHFVNLDLTLYPSQTSYWKQNEEFLCLGMAPTNGSTLSVLGFMFQRNVMMGYNLGTSQLYMYSTPCPGPGGFN